MGPRTTKPPASGLPTIIVTTVTPIDPTGPTLSEGTRTTAGESHIGLDVPSLFQPDRARFRLGELLGQGGTSRVYAAFDGDLEREVALKFVPVGGGFSQKQFVREARVTSSLMHPNVPAVYDVGKIDEGYFLALPRIRGRSLRTLIRDASENGSLSALPPNELVEVILKVCDALSYAHDHGVIHQDIKPENIMIGTYGEVMLVDWGAASIVGDGESDHPVVGTPSYMAPEQANGAQEIPQFDVYALGATLFHALLLRKPISEVDPTLFWQRKMKGELDFPTREELARHPRALLAIARRAMDPIASERYQTVAEFAAALRDFVAGGTSWSAPLVTENFRDPTWVDRWCSWERDAFEVVGEAVVSRGPLGALLYHVDRLSGGVALEYDAVMLEGAPPGDISAIWTEDDVLKDGEPRFPKQGSRTYCFQVGALSNHLVGIFRDFHQPLAVQSRTLEPGRSYRIRLELDDRLLRLSIDGELVAEYEERLPLRSGYLALYSYFPGKSFQNVRLYQRGLPEYVSPLAIGDAFFAREDYEEAEREYYRVERGQGSLGLVREARYKRGVCAVRRGNAEEALRLWEKLDTDEWRARIALQRADLDFEKGLHEATVRALGELYERGSEYRPRIIQRFCDWMARLVGQNDQPLALYLEFRDRHFPDDAPSRAWTARALLSLGRFEEVAAHFSSERLEYCDALLGLGRFDEIVSGHADMQGLVDATLIRQGRLDRVSSNPRNRARVMIALGRYSEATEVSESAEALLAAGENERVLEAGDAGILEKVTALVRLGRVEEAHELGHPASFLEVERLEEAQSCACTLEWRVRTHHALALRAFHSGDVDGLRRGARAALALPFNFAWEDVWLERYFLLPLALEFVGEKGVLDASLEDIVRNKRFYWGQRAFFLASSMLGRIRDDEFAAEPSRGGHEARLWLGRAFRAEVAGAPEEAARAYAEYSALPPERRHVDSIFLNPIVDSWVRARRRASIKI